MQKIQGLPRDARISYFQQALSDQSLDPSCGKMELSGQGGPSETFYLDPAALAEQREAISYGGFGAMQHLGNYANSLVARKIQERVVIVSGPRKTRPLLTALRNSLCETAFSCVLPDHVRPPIRMTLQELAYGFTFLLPSGLVAVVQDLVVVGAPD
ncbi:MAG: hypothetical protein WAN14_09100 [Candidatus Acidiferrales bacterium]